MPEALKLIRSKLVLNSGERFRLYKGLHPAFGEVVVKLAALCPQVPLRKLHKSLAWEAEVVSSIKHRNCVNLLKFDPHGSWIIFEYLCGGNLISQCVKDARWIREAFQIAADVADALHALHIAGFLHLDVKPRNIVFRNFTGSDPVIVDFGGARRSDRAILADTIDKSMLGSRRYLFKAPEQLMHLSERFTPQTDIFGLGATFYWLLFGESPFENSEVSTQNARKKFDEDYRRAIERCRSESFPAEAIELLESMLAFDMHKREPSAAQAGIRLRRCAALLRSAWFTK